MIQLFQFGLLFLAIRRSWCQHQLRTLVAIASRILRHWTMNAVLAAQSARAKRAGPRRAKRAQLRVLVLNLERKYWRAAKATSTGMTSALRFRRR
jgi:hypothetical protein